MKVSSISSKILSRFLSIWSTRVPKVHFPRYTQFPLELETSVITHSNPSKLEYSITDKPFDNKEIKWFISDRLIEIIRSSSLILCRETGKFYILKQHYDIP